MKTDYERWSDQMDSHLPRWWTGYATQRELQDVTNSLLQGFRDEKDAEKKLREVVGRRLFEVVCVWVSLPECAICGKTVTLGMIEEGRETRSGPQETSGLGFPKERNS